MSNTTDVLPPRHVLEERLDNQLVRIARVESMLSVARLAFDNDHSVLSKEVCCDVMVMMREVLADVREKLDVVNHFKPEEAHS